MNYTLEIIRVCNLFLFLFPLIFIPTILNLSDMTLKFRNVVVNTRKMFNTGFVGVFVTYCYMELHILK
jgi:hypothetical protein